MKRDYPILRFGSRGEEVKYAQLLLKACGFYENYAIDGLFYRGSRAATISYQHSVASLNPDGIIGPLTWASLEQSQVVTPEDPAETEPVICELNEEIFKSWMDLVNVLISTPVKYGPGRGGFDTPDRAWVIRDKSGQYPAGHSFGYYGFVCNSFTNFACAYLLRYNEQFTPGGSMVNLFEVMEAKDEIHPVKGYPSVPWRGYGPHSQRVLSTVSDVPLSLVNAQRDLLPVFLFCGEGRRTRTWYNYSHCSIIVNIPGEPLKRIAADGYRNSGGFSATPMVYRTLSDNWIADFDETKRVRPYGISFSQKVLDRPIYPVRLETI